MIARIALAALVLAGTAEAADLDIPWFMQNPSVRREWLSQCQNDGRVANAHPGICRNADAAETRMNMGRALRLDQWGLPVPAPEPEPNRPTTIYPRRNLRYGT